ncbi:MAG: DUF1643 domain-containing protein, partial [Magnetococcales bacterium]|nr:DUF1643 domain-containing protein [Magnetococcales bacterium]
MDPRVIPAAELKARFGVFGYFYRLALGGELLGCRSVLTLVAHEDVPGDPADLLEARPDLLVVMMNPGSSRPLVSLPERPAATSAEAIWRGRFLVPTRPDTTQYQVMRIMAAKGFRHARVLNLSDLREPKSPLLLARLAGLAALPDGALHSLFGGMREGERRALLGEAGAAPLLLG